MSLRLSTAPDTSPVNNAFIKPTTPANTVLRFSNCSFTKSKPLVKAPTNPSLLKKLIKLLNKF